MPASDGVQAPARDPEGLEADARGHIQQATALVTAVGASGDLEARYVAAAGFGLVRTASHSAARAAIDVQPKAVIATDADPGEPPGHVLPSLLSSTIADPDALVLAQAAARALRQIRVAARIDVTPVVPRGPRLG